MLLEVLCFFAHSLQVVFAQAVFSALTHARAPWARHDDGDGPLGAPRTRFVSGSLCFPCFLVHFGAGAIAQGHGPLALVSQATTVPGFTFSHPYLIKDKVFCGAHEADGFFSPGVVRDPPMPFRCMMSSESC